MNGDGTNGADDSADGADARGPSGFDPADIEPVGAMIAVAFTGAMIGLGGAALVAFVGDPALVFVALGIAVVLASPVAYLRFSRLHPSGREP